MLCGELMRTLEMMKTHVQKTTPNATLAEAVDLMDLYQTPALPVVDADGRLCGMLTEGDVMRAAFRDGAGTAKAGLLRVEAIMSRPAVSISTLSDVESALQLMQERGLKRLPVVNEDGQVIGMLNRVDVLQALFEGSISDGASNRT